MSDPSAQPPQGQPVKTVWWLVRHGPVINPANLIYGATDPDINTQDRSIYEPLAKVLPRDGIYLTSRRGRTVKTLQTLAAIGGFAMPAYEPLSDFDEQSFGDWEGQTWDALFQTGTSHRFWRAPAKTRPPGGESFEDVMRRVTDGLRLQTVRHAGKTLVLITHGGTIRAALAHALGLDGESALRFSIDPCALTRLTHWRLNEDEETWQIDQVNLGPQWMSGGLPGQAI